MTVARSGPGTAPPAGRVVINVSTGTSGGIIVDHEYGYDGAGFAGPRGAGPGVGGQTQRTVGEPIRSTSVGLRYVEDTWGSAVPATGRTDASGNVTFDNVAPGRYFVFLADPALLRGSARVSVSGTGAAPLSGTIAPGRSAAPGGPIYALDGGGRRLVVTIPKSGPANAQRGRVVVNLSRTAN